MLMSRGIYHFSSCGAREWQGKRQQHGGDGERKTMPGNSRMKV